MSVINETLNNLKKTKKRSSKSSYPAASAFCEKKLKTEESMGVKKVYMILIGFAMLLVGALFYLSQMFAPKWMQHHPDVARAGSENQQPALQKLAVTEDVGAQKMYYLAMALLNEGHEEQAAQKLQEIMARYPGFTPAKQAYSMLEAH